jgi:hypothetical protein
VNAELMRKALENGRQGVREALGDIVRRQERWSTYFEAAQTALFNAPEPPPKRKRKG